MSKDYYSLLGVDKTASKEEIKKAFRKKAQQYHPDKKDGDEAKFKEINEAYTVLSNDQKKAQYDQFGSASSGGGGGQGQGFGGFDFSQFTQNGNGQDFDFDLGDLFGSVFGGRNRRRRGGDISVDITLSFEESIRGIQKDLNIQTNSGKSEKISFKIPAGIDNGESLRITGRGESIEGGDPGDLYVRMHVTPHKVLRKEGHHLVMDLSVKLSDAILGTKINIETLDGNVKLKIPKGITHGEILRLRNHGVKLSNSTQGDLLIRVSIEMPKSLSKKSKKLIEELREEGI